MEQDKFLSGDKTVPEQPIQKRKDKSVPLYYKVAILVLAVLAIILLIVLLVLVVEWRNIRENALKREQTVCLKADRLKVCPQERKFRNESCCGPTSSIVSALVEKYSQEKFRNTSGARMLSESCLKDEVKSVAKLSGLDMDKIRQQGEGTCVFWDESNADKILQNVSYKNGCIRVETPGYYYVYSQIIVTNTTLLPSFPSFSHSVFGGKSNNTKRAKLLESSNSPCDSPSGAAEVSSYIGAAFYFDAGDVIHVETSHTQSLVNSRENNFFGMYSV